MRRVIFEEKGGPEVLKFETLDLPSPATGEVRIKIKAIGLNRYESMFRQGVYVVPPELPSAIGAEAVGIVEALGGDVSGFSVGDRVTAVPFTTIAGTGVYADTANVPTTTLLRSLDGTTDAEEAITWMAYLNAYIRDGELTQDLLYRPPIERKLSDEQSSNRLDTILADRNTDRHQPMISRFPCLCRWSGFPVRFR